MQVRDLVKGLYDFHIHPGPDAYARVADAIEIVQQARNAGMGGVVLKAYEFMTAQMATMIETHYPGIDVIGAICLESGLGGIHPRAVESAIRAGVKVVWLPALDSEWNHRVAHGYVAEGRKTVTHLDGLRGRADHRRTLSPVQDGKVTAEALEVFKMVGDANLVLQSGHLNENHREMVAEAALAQGVKKFVLTHANASWNYVSIEQHKRLALYPNVYFEYCALPMLPWIDNQNPSEIAAMIRTAGVERAVLGTDAGTSWAAKGLMNPHPVEALAALVGALKMQGITDSEIQIMARRNPRYLLNLEPSELTVPVISSIKATQ
ncbi:MAG: DUF6282 family protein [Chloroflexota bacterium]